MEHMTLCVPYVCIMCNSSSALEMTLLCRLYLVVNRERCWMAQWILRLFFSFLKLWLFCLDSCYESLRC